MLLLTFQGTVQATNGANETSNETIAELIDINLAKDYFQVGEKVSGTITLHLSEYVNPDEQVRARISSVFESDENSMGFEDVLLNLSKLFVKSQEGIELGLGEQSKILSFVDQGEQSVAVKIPQYANVESIALDVSAPADSTLNDVRLDVLDDEEIEWYYLGDFVDWDSSYRTPEDFIEPAQDVKKILNNNTYYCQIIDFPYSIDYEISAQYSKLQQGGDIKAVILTYDDPRYPIGGEADCDLPEQDETAWATCSIHTDYGLAGENLVCIYSSKMQEGNELYSVQVDSDPTDSAYVCSYENGLYTCHAATLSDYAIKMKGAEYSKVLNSAIDFLQWQYFPESILLSIWRYVGSSEPYGFSPICQDLECAIEFKFIANGTGQMTLENLDIEYDSADGPGESTQIYDLEIIPPKITHISSGNESINLNDTGYDLEMSLSLFNLTVTEDYDRADTGVRLKVMFLGKEQEIMFDVVGEGEAVGSELLLQEVEDAFSDIESQENAELMLEILGFKDKMDSARTEITSFRNRLLSGDSEELQDEIRDFRADLPKQLFIEATLIDLVSVEPEDITSDIVPSSERDETYFMQEDVQVKATISSFAVTDFSGTATHYAFVKKELTANKALKKVDVFETIDKSVVSSANDISFQEAPSSIVKNDPIVKWFLASLSSGSKKEFNYVLETNTPFTVESVKTIIVQSEEDVEVQKPESVCGDGICTSILEDDISCPEDCKKSSPWFWTILIILLIGLVVGALFYFYKFKGDLLSLFKKMPFGSKSELESVESFIKNSRNKKMSDVQIKKRLLDKGWDEKQVNFAFKELDKAPKKQQNLAPLKEYIKLALQKKMDKQTIAKKLVSQGWDEKLVKKELGIK